MVADNNFPKTLQEAIKYFSDETICIDFVASMRWENGIAVCPNCKNTNTSFFQLARFGSVKIARNSFRLKPERCLKVQMSAWINGYAPFG